MFKVAGVAWQKLSRQNLSRFPLMIGNSQSVLKVMLHWSTCNADSQRMFFCTNLQTCYTFESLSKTSNALQHCKYRKKSFAAGRYTRMIFRATSYHCKLALQVDQCNITFRELRIALTRIRKTIGIRRLIPYSSINNEGGRGRPSTPKTEAPYPPIHYFENANISLRVDLPSTRFPEWKLYFWKVNANLACITHRVRYQFPAQLRKGEYGWMDENADVTAEPRYHFSRAFCVFNIRWRVDQGDLTLVCASCPGDMQHAGIG